MDPVPSLLTFKIEDLRLRELSGVNYQFVKLFLSNLKKFPSSFSIPFFLFLAIKIFLYSLSAEACLSTFCV